MIDFDKGNITLVLVPSDLRAGFDKLSAIALSRLNIDVSKGSILRLPSFCLCFRESLPHNFSPVYRQKSSNFCFQHKFL